MKLPSDVSRNNSGALPVFVSAAVSRTRAYAFARDAKLATSFSLTYAISARRTCDEVYYNAFP